jgi:hypothetical protein
MLQVLVEAEFAFHAVDALVLTRWKILAGAGCTDPILRSVKDGLSESQDVFDPGALGSSSACVGSIYSEQI